MARKLRYCDTLRYSATLGSSVPVAKGKKRPPWAQPHFSYKFTSTPDLGVYVANGWLI